LAHYQRRSLSPNVAIPIEPDLRAVDRTLEEIYLRYFQED
jgi:hypothetical protein